MDAANRTSLPTSGGGGGDRISELPDDLLHRILLLCIPNTFAAAQTSLLSRRWRRVWAHLPELTFFSRLPSDPGRFADRVDAALAAHAAAEIHRLRIFTSDADPDRIAVWLRLAARRVSGELDFINSRSGEEAEEEEVVTRGAFELPCFEKATKVKLYLGFVGLAPPPSGVFAALRELHVCSVRFQGQCALGDVVSSPRCPFLQELKVVDVGGWRTLRSIRNLSYD